VKNIWFLLRSEKRMQVNSVLFACTFILVAIFNAAFASQDEETSEFTIEKNANSLTNPPNVESNFLRYEEGEELIFTVVLDKYVLGELIGKTTKDGIAFDLENYLDVLDFPIVKENEQLYTGWFIQEDYDFQLSINSLLQGSNNSLSIKGQNQSLDSHEYLFSDDILFIDEAALTKLFGVAHKINFSALEVFLQPTELLPLQNRIKRERKNVRVGNSNQPKHPELYRGYELLSPQVFDFLVSSNYRQSTGDANLNYSLLGSRDIALVHADYYIDGNDNNELNRARLKLSKRSAEGDLLGFLEATSIEVGDVRPYRQAFGQSEQESRGIRITNAQIRDSINSQSITLQGPIQIGWDAELYRNGVLIDREFDISTGQYEFLDVALIYGINEFDIVLYGPQGQKIIEKYTKTIDQNLLSGSKLTYDFSFNQINESLLGVGNFGEEDGFAFSGGIRKNLYNSMSINAGVLSQFGGDTNLNEVNLGIDSILFDRAYVAVNGRFDDNESQTLSFDARTQLFSQALSLRLSNSSSGLNDELDVNRGIFSMSGGIPVFKGFGLSYENLVDYRNQNDSEYLRFINRLGFSYKKIRLFHNFEKSKVTDPLGFTTSSYLGSVSLDSSLGPVNARFVASYSYDNSEYEPVNYQGNFSWHFTDNIKSRLNITHEVARKLNRFNLQTGWINDKFNLSTDIGYADDLGWDIGLSARFTLLGQDSEFDSVYGTDTSSTQRGTLSVRVFEDLNTNAVYDAGEPLLDNVQVLASQTFSRGKTNKTGIAVLDGIPDQKATDIIINTDTLPDPFMVPLVPGVSITFRKGLVDKLDYPVSRSAEIEGAVYIIKKDVRGPGKNIPILLKNSKGQIVKTVETEFDGYYVFEKVIPGNYWVEIPNSALESEDAHPINSLPLSITLSSELVSGADFNLIQKDYKTGFASTHGSYSNLKMLEVAKRLLQYKLKQDSPRFFYIKSKDNKSFTLLSAFSEKENIVTNNCLLFIQYRLNCDIESVDVSYLQ